MGTKRKKRIWLRWMVWPACLVLAGLIAFPTWNYVSGVRGWNALVQELEAKGEPTEYAQLLPPPNDPGIEHFSDLAVLRALFEEDESFALEPDRIEMAHATIFDPMTIDFKKAVPQSDIARRTDIDLLAFSLGWGGTVGPIEYLDSLVRTSNPLFEELLGAIDRPEGNFGRSDSPFVDRWPTEEFIVLGRIASLRALIQIHQGNSSDAIRELQVIFRLAEAMRTTPRLYPQMVRRTLLRSFCLDIIWEGLCEGNWSLEELVILESELKRVQLEDSLTLGLQGDALSTCELMTQVLEDSEPNQFLGIPIPKEWPGTMHHNKLNVLRAANQHLAFPLQDRDWRAIHQYQEILGIREKPGRQNWTILEYSDLASGDVIIALTLATQHMIHCAQIAIALERYRQQHQDFPPSLESLVPGYASELPSDVINYAPIQYRKSGSGYILYSVGWNTLDDGGTVAWRKPKEKVDWFKGDWVWVYPSSP